MMRRVILACLVAISVAPVSAFAGTVYVTPSIGVVDADVVGFKTFYKYTLDVTGETVVCPIYARGQNENQCLDGNGNNRWVKMRDAVPPNMKLSGIQVSQHSSAIILFWKRK